MDKNDVRVAKSKILKCMTEEFKRGSKINVPIFDKSEGYACFNGTDLEMVMDKVILGLYFAMEDTE